MSIRRTTIDRLNEARKSSVPTIGKGIPLNRQGAEGDIAFRITPDGLKLYIKARNSWHGVKVGESFDSLEKKINEIKSKVDVMKQFRLPSTYSVTGDFTLDVSGDIELNADGGQVTIKDGAASHFKFNCDTTAFTIYDDTDEADMFSILVGASGVTNILTVDDGAAVGHLTLIPDGDLILDPASQKVIINAGDALYLDGGGDTRIVEHSADYVRYVVGDNIMMTMTADSTDGDGNQVFFVDASVGFTQLEPTYDATTTVVDFRFSNKQFVTFDGGNIANITLIFPAMSGNFVLLLKQDGTGSRFVTNWKAMEFDESAADGSAAVVWAGGLAEGGLSGSASGPNLTNDANHVDILSFYWDADNEIAYGVATLDFQF